jgi:hypothetical protein
MVAEFDLKAADNRAIQATMKYAHRDLRYPGKIGTLSWTFAGTRTTQLGQEQR